MIKKLLKNVDYGILIVTILIFAIGIVSLKSATGGAGGDPSEYTKQIIWFVVGVFMAIALMFFDYKLYKKFSVFIYFAMLVLLVLVFRSNPTNGATSWFKVGPISLQPAEFSKIIIILILAHFIDFANEKNSLNKPLYILAIMALIAIPVLLIIKQPDYGTAIVFMAIFAVLMFCGGINYKYIIAGVLAVVIAVPLLYNFVLPEHAKNRIDVFLNPDLDPRGAGYNVIQSKLAVGSGQLTGMGLFNGNQTQMGLLPMKTTDFIFPVISEEMGFIVSATLIVLYGTLLVRIINVARTTKDNYGKLIVIGVFSVFFAHIMENIGMCLGIFPITGIPLPFISYGGSSMLTNMLLIGLVLSVSARRRNYGLGR
jgi:rod shape determining protein RodA